FGFIVGRPYSWERKRKKTRQVRIKGFINKQLHLEQHEDTHNSIKRLSFSHLLSVYLIFYSFRPFKK
ncbi:hypothetical protein, partial [Vibrio anguillarum]|uniref:hypothetical protein n=1 Tax=Vibrio anguillarum TaxID=55601 RepID=UPI001BDFB2AD